MAKAQLSLVVPAYNEAPMIGLFLERVTPVLLSTKMNFEIIFVDDGSSDNTVERIVESQVFNPHIRLITLSRNFGKESALTCGLANASGEIVIPIDCDLQDPPELIPQMIEKWREGYMVVYAMRRSRSTDSFMKRTTASLFYRLMRKLAHFSIPENVGDFRLMDRRALDALLSFPERNRFMKGLAAAVGFKQTAVLFDRDPRAAGQTKWNYWSLWNFALDGITSFSTLPLRVWTYMGGLVALCSFGYAGWVLAKTLIWGVVTPGYATMTIIMLMLGGLQMVGMGILGEYIGRIATESKQRPLYFIDGFFGFDQEPTRIIPIKALR